MLDTIYCTVLPGTLRFVERLGNYMMERTGPGENPFHAVDVGSNAMPLLVDWDRPPT